jgi:ankyrin repeat protein
MLIVAMLAILASTAAPATPPAAVHIRLERGGCLSDCSAYSLDLAGDGLAVYQGDDHVLVKGRHLYRVDPAAVAALLRRFRTSGFFVPHSVYAARSADAPRNVLSVAIGDEVWSVSEQGGDDAGAPADVLALEDAVDATAGAENWVKGGSETLRLLRQERFDFASDTGAEMLAEAAADGREEMVAGLLAAGAPVNGRSGFLRPKGEGATALEQAIAADRPAIARRLIAAGALGDPGMREHVLRSAAAACNPDLIAEVLKSGVNVNAADSRGVTPLMLAAGCEHAALGSAPDVGGPQIIGALVAAGAQPALQDEAGDGALHRAGGADDVRALLRAGAPLEARDAKGRTPLLTAANEDVALALVKAGANARALDNHNSGLVERARREGWSRVLRISR